MTFSSISSYSSFSFLAHSSLFFIFLSILLFSSHQIQFKPHERWTHTSISNRAWSISNEQKALTTVADCLKMCRSLLREQKNNKTQMLLIWPNEEKYGKRAHHVELTFSLSVHILCGAKISWARCRTGDDFGRITRITTVDAAVTMTAGTVLHCWQMMIKILMKFHQNFNRLRCMHQKRQHHAARTKKNRKRKTEWKI